MKSLLKIFVLLIAAAGILLSGCSGDHAHDEDSDHTHETETQTPEAEHAHEEKEEDHAEEGAVHLTQLQLETAGIEMGRVQQLPLENSIKVNGFLELPPQNQANVSAILGGLVQEIYVREGDPIQAGEPLAELADPAFSQVQADYRKVVSSLDYLEEDYRRKERLLSDEVGSRREFQKAKSDYESAVAEKESIESKLRMLGLNTGQILEGNTYETVPLKAPIGGFVRVIEVNTGQYAEPRQALFEIVDNEHIHIDLLVYEKDIHKVSVDQKVLFRYTNQPSGQFYEARIFSVGKAFEDNPRAVRVHAEIEDRGEGLLPGMFVDGRIITQTQTARVLPDEAIVRDGEDYFVFMLPADEDDHSHDSDEDHEQSEHADETHDDHAEEEELEFTAVPIRPGITDAGFTEVRFFEAMPENARFVTKGAYYLLSEMRKGEGGHDH